jgi:hypothetical protein
VRHVNRRLEVDVQCAVELLLGVVVEAPAAGQRVVGHEDVDPAGTLDEVAGGGDRLEVGGQRLGTLAAELLHSLVQHLLAPPAEQQVCPALVEGEGDGTADAPGCASEQNPGFRDLHGGDPSP